MARAIFMPRFLRVVARVPISISSLRSRRGNGVLSASDRGLCPLTLRNSTLGARSLHHLIAYTNYTPASVNHVTGIRDERWHKRLLFVSCKMLDVRGVASTSRSYLSPIWWRVTSLLRQKMSNSVATPQSARFAVP